MRFLRGNYSNRRFEVQSKDDLILSQDGESADCEDGDSLQSLVIGSVDMDLDQDGATRRTTRWITWELQTLRVITTRM